MMRLTTTLILSIITGFAIFLLSYCNGYFFDKFYPYKLTLESPKTNYVVGDNINLIAKVQSDHLSTIRVYQERTKSFSLSMRAAIGNQPNFADSDFGRPFPEATAKGEIEVIWIGPEPLWKPLQF